MDSMYVFIVAIYVVLGPTSPSRSDPRGIKLAKGFYFCFYNPCRLGRRVQSESVHSPEVAFTTLLFINSVQNILDKEQHSQPPLQSATRENPTEVGIGPTNPTDVVDVEEAVESLSPALL